MILPSIESIDAEQARRNLREFINQSWHVLEPTKDYSTNWHIDAMCEHLEAISQKKLDSLIIAVPPGHMKSLLTCVLWIAWDWISNPWLKWICGSYASHISYRDSLRTRQLLTSDWYKKHYGQYYKLTKLNERQISNNQNGFRFATSIDGVGTGERAHRIISDDLLNAKDNNSDAMKERAKNHLRSMSSRGIAGEHFGQVIIAQRISEDDPIGWALDQKWEKLILPYEFELDNRATTSLGFADPRKEEGEYLWPQMFPKSAIDKIKSALGRYDYAAQYQQRPTPLEGGMVKKDLLKFYTELPPILFYIDSWDTAFKTGQQNDYSVCTKWGVANNGGFYLISRFKAKVEFPELKLHTISIWRETNSSCILIEDKASGQSLAQDLERPISDPINKSRMIKLPIHKITVDTDKLLRLNACLPTLETNVYLPQNAPWLDDYIHNLTVFPNGVHDDDVDSTTQALIYLALQRGIVPQHVNMNIMSR